MNILRDITLRFLIIPEHVKKFLSSFIMHNNHSSLHSKFTKKIIWMSSEREFSSNITPRMHARNVEIHRTPFQHAPRIDQTVRRWMQNIASDWHYFFPPSSLSFFFSLPKNECIEREGRSIISRDCLSSLDEIADSVGGFVFRPIFTVKNRDIRCYDRCYSHHLNTLPRGR